MISLKYNNNENDFVYVYDMNIFFKNSSNHNIIILLLLHDMFITIICCVQLCYLGGPEVLNLLLQFPKGYI